MSTTKIALSKSSRSLNSTRSKTNLLSGKGRVLLTDAFCTDLQNGSYIASIYSVGVALVTIAFSIFDIYCLAMAEPGETHYGYFIFSFDFVFAGSVYLRRTLLASSVISLLLAFPLLISSFILMLGLRREHEQRFEPWLIIMGIFTFWRIVAIVFSSIVNDMMFTYHIVLLVLWLIIISINVFFLLVVYSNFQELSTITRLEDMAKLKMGTMSSLNTSHASHHSMHSISHSHSNSRPTTPSGKGSNSTAIA